jgi:sulfite exporter TauE/SafE
MKTLLPLDSPVKALALGGIWGWLPCGMVYSMLLTAMLSGAAFSGAMVMLVFGLGTLPTLLTMGLLGAQLEKWARRRTVRVAGGLMVLAFGVAGLARATNGLAPGWLDALCLSPPAAAQR